MSESDPETDICSPLQTVLEANSIRVADGAAQLFRRLPVVKHCCDANETIFISREDIPKPSCGLIPPDRPDFSSPAL